MGASFGGILAFVLGLPKNVGYVVAGVFLGPSSPLLSFNFITLERPYGGLLRKADTVHTVILFWFSTFKKSRRPPLQTSGGYVRTHV